MSSTPSSKTSTLPLITLISVFFFWGFVAASNTILIPLFKSNFNLMQWQSQLVDFAFYVAYFVGSIIYFVISYVSGDPLHKIGYKKGLVIGLLISAVGALGFIPAASSASFALMLTSLFVVGLGFALQQIVANPYMIALGDPATGAHRVTLAGGVNSFGTTIGPLLVSFAIFGTITGTTDINIGVETVKIPYLFLALAFVLFAIIIAFSKLPAIATHEHVEKSLGAFKYPQLLLGMLAIFVYVGVEVSIQSNLPELIKQDYILGLDAQHAVHFISLYWGGLMIGRWTGAISAFNLSKVKRNVLTVVVPVIAYAVILIVNYIKGSPVSDFYAYFPLVLILIGGFFIGKEKPAQTLMLFSLVGVAMMIVGLLTTGKVALYSFLSGGLFCSIMWPCIFSLSIAGLGKYTTQGSSLLIMMILGGAIIPIVQGYLSDLTNIHFSYIIPVFCFAYLAFYAWRVKAILQKQGIDYDAATSGSGH